MEAHSGHADRHRLPVLQQPCNGHRHQRVPGRSRATRRSSSTFQSRSSSRTWVELARAKGMSSTFSPAAARRRRRSGFAHRRYCSACYQSFDIVSSFVVVSSLPLTSFTPCSVSAFCRSASRYSLFSPLCLRRCAARSSIFQRLARAPFANYVVSGRPSFCAYTVNYSFRFQVSAAEHSSRHRRCHRCLLQLHRLADLAPHRTAFELLYLSIHALPFFTASPAILGCRPSFRPAKWAELSRRPANSTSSRRCAVAVAVRNQGGQRFDPAARFLHRLMGAVEIVEVADQGLRAGPTSKDSSIWPAHEDQSGCLPISSKPSDETALVLIVFQCRSVDGTRPHQAESCA